MALTQPVAMALGSGLSAVTGLIGSAANADSIDSTNAVNYRMQQSANQTNMAIADKNNAAAKELAELAYTRSLPVQQVNNMMAAGMSRGAAIRALSGGGSYTAPVMQGATVGASHNLPKNFDFSQIQGAFERIGNIPMVKQQMDLTDEQIDKLTEEINVLKSRETREQESHQVEQDEKLYRRDEQRSYDRIRNALEAALTENGLTYDDVKTRGDMFRLIGHTDAWKESKGDATTRVFNDITQNRQNIRDERSSLDSHNIAVAQMALLDLEKQLKTKDVRWYDAEKHAQLVKVLRESEKVLADGRLTDANAQAQVMENAVRAVGIDNEQDARKLETYVRRLQGEYDVWKTSQANSSDVRTFKASLENVLSILSAILPKISFK